MAKLTQRDRAKRAKMVARYNARKLNNNAATCQSQSSSTVHGNAHVDDVASDAAASSLTATADDDCRDDADDENIENRNSSNVAAAREPPVPKKADPAPQPQPPSVSKKTGLSPPSAVPKKAEPPFPKRTGLTVARTPRRRALQGARTPSSQANSPPPHSKAPAEHSKPPPPGTRMAEPIAPNETDQNDPQALRPMVPEAGAGGAPRSSPLDGPPETPRGEAVGNPPPLSSQLSPSPSRGSAKERAMALSGAKKKLAASRLASAAAAASSDKPPIEPAAKKPTVAGTANAAASAYRSRTDQLARIRSHRARSRSPAATSERHTKQTEEAAAAPNQTPKREGAKDGAAAAGLCGYKAHATPRAKIASKVTESSPGPATQEVTASKPPQQQLQASHADGGCVAASSSGSLGSQVAAMKTQRERHGLGQHPGGEEYREVQPYRLREDSAAVGQVVAVRRPTRFRRMKAAVEQGPHPSPEDEQSSDEAPHPSIKVEQLPSEGALPPPPETSEAKKAPPSPGRQKSPHIREQLTSPRENPPLSLPSKHTPSSPRSQVSDQPCQVPNDPQITIPGSSDGHEEDDIPEIAPATSYRTQRELYMKMRAMEEAGLERQTRAAIETNDPLTSPTDSDALGLGQPRRSGSRTASSSFDSSTFLGVVGCSESSEASDDVVVPNLEDQLVAESLPSSVGDGSLVEAEGSVEVDGVAQPPSAEEKVAGNVVHEDKQTSPCPHADGVSSDALSTLRHAESDRVDDGDESCNQSEAEPKAQLLKPCHNDVIAQKPSSQSSFQCSIQEKNGRSAEFDDFEGDWPEDNFSSTSWGSQPSRGGEGFNDPPPPGSSAKNKLRLPPTNDLGVTVRNSGGWNQVHSTTPVGWESDNDETPVRRGNPEVPHDAGVERGREKLECGVDDRHTSDSSSAADDSASSRSQGRVPGAPFDGRECDLSQIQKASSSGSFDWNGIGDENGTSAKDTSAQVKSTTKEQKTRQQQSNNNQGSEGDNEVGQQIDEAESSTAFGSAQYEGFGSVLDSDNPSCRTEDDGDSGSYDDDIGDCGGSKGSDAMNDLLDDGSDNGTSSDRTTGSATEFDPLSMMFGECDDMVPNISHDEGDFGDAAPIPGEDQTKISTLSWTSTRASSAPNPLSSSAATSSRPSSDDSRSISFPSLNSQTLLSRHPSAMQQQQPAVTGTTVAVTSAKAFAAAIPVPDSPAGTESLESWWQSRYASTQNSDINSAVQEALARRMVPSPSEQRAYTSPTDELSEMKHGPTRSSEGQVGGIGSMAGEKDENEQMTQPTLQQSPMPINGEEDSIFSGLDDISLPSVHQQQPQWQQPNITITSKYSSGAQSSARAGRSNKSGVPITIAESEEEEEDIFSGVSVASPSVASRPATQISSKLSSSQYPRLKESKAMKSLLDGTSSAESLSVKEALPSQRDLAGQRHGRNIQGINAPTSSTALQGSAASSSSRLFLPDRGYGVINLRRIDRSPTDGASSVTSDITSSVIFGGSGIDFGGMATGTRRTSARCGGSRPLDILETTDEAAVIERHQQHLDDLVSNAVPGIISPLPEEGFEEDAVVNDVMMLPPPPNQNKDTLILPLETNNDEHFSKNVSRGVSLMSPSTNDSPTHLTAGSSSGDAEPSLLKKAQMLVVAKTNGLVAATGGRDDIGDTAMAAADDAAAPPAAAALQMSETMNKVKSSFLSQFTCGVFAASSFTFCAVDDVSKIGSPKQTLPVEETSTSRPSQRDAVTDPQGKGLVASASNASGTFGCDAITKSSETIESKGTSESITTSKDGPDMTEKINKAKSRFAGIHYSSGIDSDDGFKDGGRTQQSDDGKEESDSDEDGESDENSASSGSDDTYAVTISEDMSNSSSGGTTIIYDESTMNDAGTLYDGSTIFTEGDTPSLPAQVSAKRRKKYNKSAILSRNKNVSIGTASLTGSATPQAVMPQRKETIVARSGAYEKLLMYAYTALSVPAPPQNEVVEKAGVEKNPALYPAVSSPNDAEVRNEALSKILSRLSSEGMEVLKLNREKKWQPRFLTVTREVTYFRKSDDVRFSSMTSCPIALLWMKKFDPSSKNQTVASIDKNGKGGLLFSSIRYVSVMKDDHPLSRKQKKGKFKNSITFVLHSINSNGVKREVYLRCMNKEDIFAMSVGFQAIIDRIKNDNSTSRIQMVKGQLKKMSLKGSGMDDVVPRVLQAATKPFIPKTGTMAEDRWEV